MSIITKIQDKIIESRLNKLRYNSNELVNRVGALVDAARNNDINRQIDILNDISKVARKIKGGKSSFQSFSPIKRRLQERDRTLIYNGMFVNTYNLADLYHAYTKETYFKTAIDKYIEGVIKRGYHIQSKTPEVVKYLNKRLKEIEFVSNLTLKEIIRSLLFSILAFGNTFLIRLRSVEKSTGKRHRWKGKSVKPIAGLYVPDPRRMIIFLDGKNNKKYAITPGKVQPSKSGAISDLERLYSSIRNFPKLLMGVFGGFGMGNTSIYGELSRYLNSNNVKVYSESDIDHIKYHPTPGEEWAMPPFWPALEDINMLRSIETAVDLLIYQFGSVLIHVQVSNPVQNAVNNIIKRPPSEADMADVRNSINNMDSNGFIVTGDHVKMDVLNIAQNVIRLEDYLLYFKERVFTGLWLSSVTTGESSNGVARSVADTIVDEKTSKIIELQSLIKEAVDSLLYELLLEAGLTHDEILDKNIYPELVFDDVDVELELKKRDTVLRLWESGLITEQESRMMLNMDAMDDKEREYTYPRLVKAYLIKVKEEMAAEAMESKLESIGSEKEPGNTKAANNIVPENQTGKKYNSKKPVNK